MQAERTTLEPRRHRGGRPPATLAGDVDRRILVAATGLFLRLGFDATSCDQVVAQAGLYARYANKEALFVAVVHDAFLRMAVPLLDESVDLPLHARLRAVGESILRQALQPDMVALLRVILSIAHRMPDLAQFADRIGREQAVQRVAVVIAGKAIAGKADVGATDRALPVAAKFIDLVFVPYQMRALMGDEPEALMASASRGIDDAVDLLAKAGWLEGWE
jgi:AcrR family transcriptional regulator